MNDEETVQDSVYFIARLLVSCVPFVLFFPLVWRIPYYKVPGILGLLLASGFSAFFTDLLMQSLRIQNWFTKLVYLGLIIFFGWLTLQVAKELYRILVDSREMLEWVLGSMAAVYVFIYWFYLHIKNFFVTILGLDIA